MAFVALKGKQKSWYLGKKRIILSNVLHPVVADSQ
jgi:hypothetical protein